MALPVLTSDIAARFAAIALGHVRREYPHRFDHVATGPRDIAGPQALHPVFYGSYDWHSCVHGFWLLARLRRRFPGEPFARQAALRFDAAFTAPGVAAEIAYLSRPASAGFERPYGWAWLLALAAELSRHIDASGRKWARALAPMAQLIAGRFADHLLKADYPVRSGAHANSAFALLLAFDYAETCQDARLATHIKAKAQAWFDADAGAQAWEPSGEDFLSPTLSEAMLMRRVLGPETFLPWLGRFLPGLADGRPRTLFMPVTVSDRTDGKIAHLDGLNLSRAWAWRALAEPSDPRRTAIALDAAARHLNAALPHVAGDYMGEHWLATFALLALDGLGDDEMRPGAA